MSAGVKLDGVDELRELLKQLPAHLTDLARVIVYQHADSAANAIAAAYPEADVKPGDGIRLRDATKVIKEESGGGKFGVLARVVNRHPLANIYEVGTAVRKNAAGANRGSMPAAHVFIPRAVIARRHMYEVLRAMIVDAGFSVTGSVDDAAT